jgi:hypothetical protein
MYIVLILLGIICVMLPVMFNYLEGMDVSYSDDREKVDELPKFTTTPQEREELGRLIQKNLNVVNYLSP